MSKKYWCRATRQTMCVCFVVLFYFMIVITLSGKEKETGEMTRSLKDSYVIKRVPRNLYYTIMLYFEEQNVKKNLNKVR